MHKIRVFVADDDQAFLSVVKQVLEREGRFNVKINSGRKGFEAVIEEIAQFKPHILIVDMFFDDIEDYCFTGIDLLKRFVNQKRMLKYVLSGMGDSDVATRATELGAICFSKPFMMQPFLHDQERGIYANLSRMINTIKKRKLNKLLKEAQADKVESVWYDQSDIKKEGPGSEVMYVNFGKYKSVRSIGLFLSHTNPSHGSCLSISFGCERNCTICKSGTEEVFRGHFKASEIVSMQESIMRNCFYYNEVFWLDGMSFFVAIMGAGDIAFNFKETIKAVEIMRNVFGERFICNISTAFISGITKMIAYVKSSQVSLKPNLQISLHGVKIETRKQHVDSNEDPFVLLKKGLEYARISNTLLTVNYGLTDKNSHLREIKNILREMDPSISRIKFSKMILPEKSGLKPAKKIFFYKAKAMAEKFGIQCEIFDEDFQMGLKTGGSCGNIVNKIAPSQENGCIP